MSKEENLLLVLRNFLWYSGDKVLRIVVALTVNILIARYLGPDGFGRLSFAIALVAMFSALSELGLQNVAVKELVTEPGQAGSIMGSSTLLICISSLLCIGGFLAVLQFPESPQSLAILAICGASLLAKPARILEFWFQAQSAAKPIVIVSTLVLVAVSLTKLLLVYFGAPVEAFAWAYLAEMLLMAAGIFVAYQVRADRPIPWQISLPTAKRIFGLALPGAISGMAIIIYMRVDQVMLGALLDASEVGHYAAAVNISEAWYFLPSVLALSIYPQLAALHKEAPVVYTTRLRQLYAMAIWTALIAAVALSIMSSPVITLLYGEDFAPAGEILGIHVWTGIFVAFGLIKARAIVLQGTQLFGLLCTGIGCVVNIVLNFLLIPEFGGTGAAMSTVLSQVVASIIVPLFYAKDREHVVMFFESLTFVRRIWSHS